jgi:hypothetical protein
MRNALHIMLLLTLAPVARAQPEEPAPASQPEITVNDRGIIAEDAETAESLEALKRPPRFWVRSEFMMWWIRAPNFPALVTQGEFSDPTPGALSEPNTSLLFGGSTLRFRNRHGGRFSAGYWFDDDSTFGIEANYFFIGGRDIDRGFTSPGNPVLAMPFFNVNNGGAPDSSLVTFPGIMSGGVFVAAPSLLQGAELNLTANLWQSDHVRLEALAGFRYLHLRESLELSSVSAVRVAPQYAGLGIPFDGNTIFVRDQFATTTAFYGGQVGARLDLTRKRFTLGLLGKIALGCSREVVTIRGFTGIDTQPATSVNAGLFALSTNSGRHGANSIAFVPEVGVSLKFQLNEHIGLLAGYSFLYWSRVARPGDQIDPNINVNLVPTSRTFGAGGVVQPAFNLRHTDFFAHGVHLGVEVRY